MDDLLHLDKVPEEGAQAFLVLEVVLVLGLLGVLLVVVELLLFFALEVEPAPDDPEEILEPGDDEPVAGLIALPPLLPGAVPVG